MEDPKIVLLRHMRGFEKKYPRQLALQFPHVVRKLVEYWEDPVALEAYITDLLIPSRPNRKGFPAPVAAEILTLSLAYETIREVNKNDPDDVWAAERAMEALTEIGVTRSMANLAHAIESGNREVCTLFIQSGFDVNSRDSRQWTPLMMAAFNGREELALDLILGGAEVNAKDTGGYSPMHWAAYNGYSNVIRMLKARGGNVNDYSRAGITPLIQASAKGHVEATTELLKLGANPNQEANDGSTPLTKAISNEHLPIVDILMDAGASRQVTLQNGVTLWEIAQKAKNQELRQRIFRGKAF